MRENRTCGSEGGEAQSLPYPYPASPSIIALLSTIHYQLSTINNYQLSIIHYPLFIIHYSLFIIH